jgi:deferrochelatase/peroxidase EfeB
VKIFDRKSKFDMINQFVTPVGGGLFAIPPVMSPAAYIEQGLVKG